MSRPLLLIDSYAQIFRVFFAIRQLTDSRGEPVNVLFGMAKLLMKLHSEFPDCDGIFAFDQGKPPHRLALAPAYKANRPPCPEELKVQLEPLDEMISAFGWNRIKKENWEADDLIAGIAAAFPNRKIFVMSADKDLCQLVNDNVEMLIPSRDGKGFEHRGISQVIEHFGVRPAQITDYLAMIGDSADNIPGIEGVGPKTAASLLNEFGSIDAILANPEKIGKEKLRTKIVNGANTLKKNIELVKLVSVPPEGVRWSDSDFIRKSPDWNKLKELAERYELKAFRKELDTMAPEEDSLFAPAPEPQPQKKQKLEQPDLF